MAENSHIAWTGPTHNFWIGCEAVSPGCNICYAKTLEERWGHDFSKLRRTTPTYWNNPYRWQKALAASGETKMVFTCSLSDFFHVDADPWRDEAWQVIRDTPNLIWQILTKRPARIERHLPQDWGDGYSNVWLGVTGEDQEWADRRLKILRNIPAAVRFLSYEPALGPVALNDYLGSGGLDWVIVGGESGPGARPMRSVWAAEVIRDCKAARVPVFFKQTGVVMARLLSLQANKGDDPAEWPEYLNIQQFPALRPLGETREAVTPIPG